MANQKKLRTACDILGACPRLAVVVLLMHHVDLLVTCHVNLHLLVTCSIGRCEGGWIAPFWCDAVKRFYVEPTKLKELKGPNITGSADQMAVQAAGRIGSGDVICPYIGFLLDLTAKDERGTRTHLLEVATGWYIDPFGGSDRDHSVTQDVGHLAMNYPEAINFGGRLNTVGTHMKIHHGSKTNCKLGHVSLRESHLIWIKASCVIQAGT